MRDGRSTACLELLKSKEKLAPVCSVAAGRMKKTRESLLSAATSVQYESANESATQMGVTDLPPEPFTEKQ